MQRRALTSSRFREQSWGAGGSPGALPDAAGHSGTFRAPRLGSTKGSPPHRTQFLPE